MSDEYRCVRCKSPADLAPVLNGERLLCLNSNCRWAVFSEFHSPEQWAAINRLWMSEPPEDQDERSFEAFILRLMKTANMSDLERDVIQDCILEMHKSFHLQLERWRESFEIFETKHRERLRTYVDNKPDKPNGPL